MLLVPGFHMAEMSRGGCIYLLAEGITCVLFDTGAPDGTLGAGQLIEAAGRKPFEVRLIVLTHGHPGHSGNAESLRRLTGASVAASAAAAATLREPQPERVRGWRRLVGGGEAAPPVHVDRILEPGERLDLAGGIDVLDAPGHGAGSLAFHLLGAEALVVGDAAGIGAEGLAAPPTRLCEDAALARETVGRLRGIGVRCLAPGHGYPMVEGRLPRRQHS